GVGVFDAKDEDTIRSLAGEQPVEQRGSGRSDVEVASRRRCKPDPRSAHWLLLNRDSAVRAACDGLAKSIVELGTGVLVQDVEEAVVTNLKNLGSDPHADRVRRAEIKVD